MTTEKPHEAHHGHGHDAHGHGHGSVFIQHHYDDAQHQFDAGKLGIWLFLAQEVLFFSALFVAYVLYRHHHPEIYAYAHKYLDVKYGAINTAVLIFSSLTAAWAVRAAQLNQKKLLVACIGATIACALGFLVIKYIEYTHKIQEHILFGERFDPCVSSGGTPLLTKNNKCPGHKSTVTWDYGAKTATGGCFKDIDQNPRTQGVQPDCVVFEATMAPQQKKNEDGTTTTEWVEKSRRPITNRCADKYWPDEAGSLPSSAPKKGQTDPAAAGAAGACWRVGYNPHVCKKDVGVIVEYGDHKERGNEIRIVAECKPTPPPQGPENLLDTPENTQVVLGQKAAQGYKRPTKGDAQARLHAGPPPENTNMFFTIYFAMTGLHGIHVLVGVFVFIWLLIRAIKGHFTPDYFGPVDFAALYWHIVDLIWIFLFPLLYLIH